MAVDRKGIAGLLFIFLHLQLRAVLCRQEPDRFLFISSPTLARVFYVRMPAKRPVTGPGAPKHKPQPLIDSGLKYPMGLAADQSRSKLYVADLDAKKVLAYKIAFLGERAVAEQPTVAMEGVEARWIACDARGSVFASDQFHDTIWKVSADASLRNERAPKALYSGLALTQVSGPSGIAVDNFHIYWSNRENTDISGSVVKALEAPVGTDAAEAVSVLTKNAENVHAVCLARDNLFYTSSDSTLFGVKKNGGTPGEIAAGLVGPRGCTWDGDGTVFVAQRGANPRAGASAPASSGAEADGDDDHDDDGEADGGGEVLAFAGNMPSIMPAKLSKVVSLEGAYDVAVLVGASSSGARLLPQLSLKVMILILLAFWH